MFSLRTTSSALDEKHLLFIDPSATTETFQNKSGRFKSWMSSQKNMFDITVNNQKIQTLL